MINSFLYACKGTLCKQGLCLLYRLRMGILAAGETKTILEQKTSVSVKYSACLVLEALLVVPEVFLDIFYPKPDHVQCWFACKMGSAKHELVAWCWSTEASLEILAPLALTKNYFKNFKDIWRIGLFSPYAEVLAKWKLQERDNFDRMHCFFILLRLFESVVGMCL